MAAARRLRYAPSGPFSDETGSDATSIYSVDTDGTVQTDPETPLVVQTWTVPADADGDYLLQWFCEVTTNASDTPLEFGSVSLTADAVAVSESTLNQVITAPAVAAEWYAASGFAVRTLAAGDVVNLVVTPGAFEAIQLSARRRRIVAIPVTVLT